jgi:hypothetical protein
MQYSRLAILRRELRRAIAIGGSKADGKNIVFQLEDPFQRPESHVVFLLIVILSCE